MASENKRFTFRSSHRLHGKTAFEHVFAARRKKSIGPLTVFGLANHLDHSRLGLSVPRRVGNAVTRNRLKRLIREAFRLSQWDLPQGYDWIVVIRRHEPLHLEDYQRMLTHATRRIANHESPCL